MTYYSEALSHDEGSGSSSSEPLITYGIGYRNLTESQGARSRYYRTLLRGTFEELRLPIDSRVIHGSRGVKRSPGHSRTAEREHVGRLLRSCHTLTDRLLTVNDAAELADLGATLCDNLEDLWRYRLAREDDWIDILNLLQIVLRGENFETMTMSKKAALAALFNNSLTVRTIASIEAQRAVRMLREAGFDIWRGLGEAQD